MECIHIAVTADERYAGIAGVLIASALKKTTTCPIVFHVIESGFSQRSKDRISSLKELFPNGEFRFYSVNDTSMFDELELPEYISRAATLRLLLPELLNDVPKVLYLDCDTTVCRDLTEIWNTPLDRCWIGGVLDCHKALPDHCAVLDLAPEHYFNSGVLLMNLEEMRRSDYRQVFAENIREYGSRITMADQDLLNLSARGRFKPLHLRWNLHRGYLKYAMPWTDRQELAEAIREPGIVHFTGGRKPWDWSLRRPRHIFWREWFLAARGTVFSEELLFFLKNHIISHFWRSK